jgi:hypothetical protein
MRRQDLENQSQRDKRVEALILKIETSEASDIEKVRMLVNSVHVDVIDFLGTHNEEKLNEALMKLTYLLEEKMA